MNLTIINLIYPLLLSQSPAFVGNNLLFANSKFDKFTSLLFYNQQNIFLKGSEFRNGINGIIIKESENSGKYFVQTSFNNDNFTSQFSAKIKEFHDCSISIIDCSFLDLSNQQGNLILINDKSLSIYMTDNIFYNCISSQGAVRLQSCRCVTLTHTCSLESKSESQYIFYYYDCVADDFSIFLYSTIANSKCIGSDDNDVYASFCKSGNQYSRCNNYTSTTNGIHYEAPLCFSFAMNTVIDCKHTCFKFSGDCSDFKPKEIQMVNFVSSNGRAIRISSKCNQKLTISNSVLQTSSGQIYSFDQDDSDFVLVIKDCWVTSQEKDSRDVTFINCTNIAYDQDKITIYPHYTRGEYCKGKPIEDDKAKYGCNVGNCIDNHCNYTIGFPPGVPQYSTFIHTDLQTASFTPSKKFTQSSYFSESLKFTQSKDFTQSKIFTDSDDFDRTSRFTKSNTFSDSNQFSTSISFSNSEEQSINGGGDGGNQGSNDKNKIGIIAGSTVAAAAAVGGGIAAFFLIKKRMGVKVEDVPTMNNDEKPGINVENDLEDVMDRDDPFADEFANH